MLSFIRANARWLFGGFLLTFFSSFGQTFFIGLSGEELRARFALSDGEFGLIYMVATLGSAATLPFLGRLLDVVSGRQAILFVIPPLAMACASIAFAPSVVLLIASIYLLRLFGQGMMTHIAMTETGRWFAAARGRAISLVVPGHQAGEAILPIAFVLVSAMIGWQAAWLIASTVLIVAALPMIYSLYSREREPLQLERGSGPDRTARDWTRSEVVRDPCFYVLLTGVLAPAFIGTTVFFHQDHLIELRGYDPLAFAAAFPVMALTTVIFSLICGQLVDRFGAVRLLPYFLVPLTIASIAASVLTSVWGIYLFMLLLGVSYGFTSTLFGALWPELYGIRYLGGVRAMIVSAMVFATALGPGLTGYLIDTGINLPEQLLWMGAWCAGATVMLSLASRPLAHRAARDPKLHVGGA
ncbi:MAG: MFS transporter [Erythrobacter sp.]